ncbi:MAG: hypothetical protein WBG91_16635, partial [Syntrophobacteria bacterium]
NQNPTRLLVSVDDTSKHEIGPKKLCTDVVVNSWLREVYIACQDVNFARIKDMRGISKHFVGLEASDK